MRCVILIDITYLLTYALQLLPSFLYSYVCIHRCSTINSFQFAFQPPSCFVIITAKVPASLKSIRNFLSYAAVVMRDTLTANILVIEFHKLQFPLYRYSLTLTVTKTVVI